MSQLADPTAPPVLTDDAAAAPRPCRACAAPMQAGQDWCLTCGTAAPGRLGSRPGWRTVNSVAAVTLVLITGAVAASYAALSGDASSKAGQAPPASVTPLPGQVAQVPDAVVPPPTTPPVVPPPPTPKVPKTPKIPVTPVTPVTPPQTSGDDEPNTATGDTDPSTTATTDADEPTTPAVTLTKIELGADAMSAYDPGKRITRSGDTADAYDGDRTTAWSVTTPDDGFPMQVGLLVDLESPKMVKQLNLGSTTPGGRVEIYGAVGSALPPDILDTRWEQVAARSNVDGTSKFGNRVGDKREKIRLLNGGGRFRYVLVWFTTPPKASTTARVTELDVLG